MSDHDGNGSAESDEDREWREHAARYDAVRALEKRLGSLETAVRAGNADMTAKLDRLLKMGEETRHDLTDLYKRWIKLIDLQLNTEKRVAALETRPAAKKRK